MTSVLSVDIRANRVVEEVATEADSHGVHTAVNAANAAGQALDEMGRRGRAALLRAMSTALDAARADIVPLADRETALGQPRLEGELTRTCFQLDMFADVIDEGSYLEASIDPAAATAMGPRPDLRRMLVPIGPVAVFGASNFPLAFSAPGGDTASALAAGNSVVVKAHPSHPGTSELCVQILRDAARRHGTPEAVMGIVHGVSAGAELVAHPAIRAVGFTGSQGGGQALLDIIGQRPEPIPFYGELASINPLVVTPGAARDRGAEIGQGAAQSFTLGSGQFCTKPGILLLPTGADGNAVAAATAKCIDDDSGRTLLNPNIAETYRTRTESLTQAGEFIRTLVTPKHSDYGVGAALYEVDAANLSPAFLREVFGPVSLIVRYSDERELLAVLDAMPGSLTVTVHSAADEQDLVSRLSVLARTRAGRLVYDGFPTGVAVSWAQHHGGPWPATNSLHTSVGATAIRRFLRPVAWQSAPQHVLPPELRDGPVDVPRRVDGLLQLPSVS